VKRIANLADRPRVGRHIRAKDMSEDLKNFRAWYVDVLEDLRAQRDAGLVSLMIAMPLLERYIRSKNCVPPEDSLNQACMVTVCGIFQALPDVDAARKFWGVFRNGFLHQATLSLKTNAGRNLPAGSLTHDIAAPVTLRPDGSFVVIPISLARRSFELLRVISQLSSLPVQVRQHCRR
jgi:hypothetical protein